MMSALRATSPMVLADIPHAGNSLAFLARATSRDWYSSCLTGFDVRELLTPG